MIRTNPGYKSWYPSSMCSPYYTWFARDLNYPMLDVLKYNDGSWDIIQFLNKPYVPAETKWEVVLGNMKNVLITFGFLEKYAKQCDMEQREFWDREHDRSALAIHENEKLEEHKAESVALATKAVVNNPDLMDRIVKKGISEVNLDKLSKHIPKTEFQKPLPRKI